jgi:hypothetical protein
MALLKFFEGKEGSYSPPSHSGGLYFAKDTGVILFKGIIYGGQPDLSGYATKSDISSLQSKLNEKADADHTHSKSDITDLGLASTSQDGLMSKNDKANLDEVATDKAKIVKHVFFNKSISNSLTSPGTTLHDINIEDNKFGLFFNGPLVAQHTTFRDPINTSSPDVQMIKVSMPQASASTNGFMTSIQASQLSSLYTSHGGKTYLPLSGGTVTDNLTVNGKTTLKGLVIPVDYYAKYESWLAESYINDFGGQAECSFQVYTNNGDWRFVRQTKAKVDTADGTGDYAFIVCQANKNMQLGNQRTIINYSDGSITTPKVTQTSDERLKENINPITEDLNKLTNIEFKEFNYKKDKNKVKSYGVIAQDLEKAGLNNLVVEDDKGYKSVDYTSLLVLEIQRLRKEIDTLKSKFI